MNVGRRVRDRMREYIIDSGLYYFISSISFFCWFPFYLLVVHSIHAEFLAHQRMHTVQNCLPSRKLNSTIILLQYTTTTALSIYRSIYINMYWYFQNYFSLYSLIPSHTYCIQSISVSLSLSLCTKIHFDFGPINPILCYQMFLWLVLLSNCAHFSIFSFHSLYSPEILYAERVFGVNRIDIA